MAKKFLFLLMTSALLPHFALAGGTGKATEKKIEGYWIISDIKIEGADSQDPFKVSADNCYFTKPYKNRMTLRFDGAGNLTYIGNSKEKGKESYTYVLADSVITISAESPALVQTPDREISEWVTTKTQTSFFWKFEKGRLVLYRNSGIQKESYTLTKE